MNERPKETRQETRWLQKLENFEKAYAKLQEILELESQQALSDFEKESLIKRFEYSYEAAWKAIKAFYIYIGNADIKGSADAFRQAFADDIITDETHIEALLASIDARNDTTHIYNEERITEIFNDIKDSYAEAYKMLLDGLLQEKQKRAKD